MSIAFLTSLQYGFNIDKLLNASFFVAENISDFETKRPDLNNLLDFNNSIFGLTPAQNSQVGQAPTTKPTPAKKPAAKPAAEKKPTAAETQEYFKVLGEAIKNKDHGALAVLVPDDKLRANVYKEHNLPPAPKPKPATKPAAEKPAAEKPAAEKPAATTPASPNANSLFGAGIFPPALNFTPFDWLSGAGQSGVPGLGTSSIGSLGDFSIFNWLNNNPFEGQNPEPVKLPTSTSFLDGLFGSSFSAMDPLRIIGMFAGGVPL